MALPGTVLEETGTSCNAVEQQQVFKLLVATEGYGEHMVCASLLLQRMDNEACYDAILRSSLVRLKALREPTKKETDRQSPWKHLDTLCSATMDRVPEYVTPLKSSVRNTIDTLSTAAMLASAVLPRQRTSELFDDLCSQFWNKWAEHQLDSCTVPDVHVGSGDLGVVWEGWLRCHMVLCGILAVRAHVGTLLDGQLHVDRWLCEGDAVGRVALTLASSTPKVLHACYQQWLAGDDGRTEGVCAELLGCDFQVFKTCHCLCSAGLVLVEIANSCIYSDSVLEVFVETILRIANDYWKHLIQVCQGVPSRLSPKVWYLTISSWTLLHEMLDLVPLMEGPRLQLMQDLCLSCDTLRDQVTSYHTQLCITTLLQDPSGHNWSNGRPFFEGQHCSFAVQMWAYHLKGLRCDLWKVCPPQVAGKVFGEVLCGTLLHIEKRYSSVVPSLARLPQFRGDIIGTLATVASFLGHLLPSTSDILAAVHTQCWSLLCSLAIVGCTLDLLGPSVSMMQHSTPPVWSGEDCGGCGWRGFLDLSAFGLPCPSGKVNETVAQLWRLIRAPKPQWDILLSVLLDGNANVAAILCHSEGTVEAAMEGSLAYHIATVLSQCYHKPQALNMALKGTAVHNDISEVSLAVRWLSCTLGPVLKSTIWSLAAKFIGFLKRQQASGLNSVLEEVLACIEQGLAHLPQPVLHLLWDMALGSGPHQDQGPALAKVVGTVLLVHIRTSGLSLQDIDQPLLAEMNSFYESVGALLDGTLWTAGPQEVLAFVHRTTMQRRLKVFGSTHCPPPPPEAASPVEKPCHVEHEIVAQLLAEDDRVLSSLRLLYNCVKDNEEIVAGVLSDPRTCTGATLTFKPTPSCERFNPVVAMTSLGLGKFDHSLLLSAEMVNWKALVPEAVDRARRMGTLKTLIGNRPEMQQGADLNEHVAQIVMSVRQSLLIN